MTNMTVNVMTLNLCWDTDSEQLSPNCWEKRKDACVEMLLKYQPTILCSQDGVISQLDYIKDSIQGYDHFGVPKGEASSSGSSEPVCAVLYNRNKVERCEGGTFWLSEWPCGPHTKSWGAQTPSSATWATFQIRNLNAPGYSFQVVNAKFDKSSRKVQSNCAFMLWRHVSSLPPNLPVILCGNFATCKATLPGAILLGKSFMRGMAGDMRDAWACALRKKNTTIPYTVHDFRGENRRFREFLRSSLFSCYHLGDAAGQDLHSDWIFFRSRFLSPAYSELVTWTAAEGQFPSSHYPLYVNFALPRSVRLAGT